jgi:multicomponent Na+:H+ antiporter subunit B
MRPWSLLLVLLVALPLVAGVATLPPHDAPDAPIHTQVGALYLERGVAETGMKNLVTAVLLNYRGFDTFIEVVVIFTALAAVLALPKGSAPVPKGSAPVPKGSAPVPKGSAPAGKGGSPTSSSAGAARSREDEERPEVASDVPVSPVVRFVVRLLAPFIAMFAVAMLFRGHITPGGGFQAAAVFAAIFIALGLALGQDRAARLVPVDWRPWLQGVAPLAFALVAWIGWRLTGAFLGYPIHDHTAQEAMGFVLEIGIAVGGGVILARIFLEMET